MQVQLPHRHGNHRMPSDMTCHVSFHQESAGNLEAASVARRVSQISLMFIVARKWMQLCAIIGWRVPERSPATRLKKHTHSQNACVHTCTWLPTDQRRRLWLRGSHDQDWVSTGETWGPLPSCHRALPVPSFPGLNVQRVGDESPPQHVDKARTDRSTYSPGLLCVGETPEIASWLPHGGLTSKCELSVLVHAFSRCSPSHPDTASSKEPQTCHPE